MLISVVLGKTYINDLGSLLTVESVVLPRVLIEELRRRGLDAESVVIDLLLSFLNIDPRVIPEVRLELAAKYLNEGKGLIGKDPVQASEKLYKAAEEAIKAMAICLNLDVAKSIEGKGRWTVTDLVTAVRATSRIVGKEVRGEWDTAWVLHVWGFHEAKLSADDVKDRLQDVEDLVKRAEETCKGSHA